MKPWPAAILERYPVRVGYHGYPYPVADPCCPWLAPWSPA
jgi:hypothetical protein